MGISIPRRPAYTPPHPLVDRLSAPLSPRPDVPSPASDARRALPPAPANGHANADPAPGLTALAAPAGAAAPLETPAEAAYTRLAMANLKCFLGGPAIAAWLLNRLALVVVLPPGSARRNDPRGWPRRYKPGLLGLPDHPPCRST
jgi:hypothetical protein